MDYHKLYYAIAETFVGHMPCALRGISVRVISDEAIYFKIFSGRTLADHEEEAILTAVRELDVYYEEIDITKCKFEILVSSANKEKLDKQDFWFFLRYENEYQQEE